MKFTDSKGSAQKKQLDQYEIKMGDNVVRFFGELLPRYLYWIKGTNDKNIPIECLSFDRNTESWANAEKDWVREQYPDIKATWSYSVQCIDPADGKAKIFNLKKKLFDQILEAAKDLGDPTDLEDGWEVHFTKKKTGPHVYNVEYTLNQIKSMQSKGAVMNEHRAAIDSATPIAELLPRATSDAQKELLDKIHGAGDDNTDNDSMSEDFDVS